MSNNGITDMSEDENGYIWVGTVQGMNRINTETGEIKNYTKEMKRYLMIVLLK
ncbi:MAG: two-component regulator propeller domain-containing protein [Paeniclostridium sp.]